MTAKDRNSNSSRENDTSLPRNKILRGRRNFEQLFEKSTLLSAPSISFRYRIYTNPDNTCMIGFIAPKRLFKHATARNKAKRLMREAYRLNQHRLSAAAKKANLALHGAFICNKINPSFDEIRMDVIALLERTEKNINKYGNTAG